MNVGTVISGKYQIEREIKRGGFGIIYQGVDQNFGKVVAIKAVAPTLLGEAKYIDMFQQEAVNIARLNHQNIVQVFDIKRQDDGQIYIIMEYIDGFDLMTLLKACRQDGKQLPITLSAYIIAEVCNGLDYAHNRRHPDTNEPMNLVHKDISPVNIMVSRTGEIKIIDFGMATFKRQQMNGASTVEIQGNVYYLAPEQIKKSGETDRRTDIFALGVILFELLTGERLTPSSDRQEIIENTLLGEYDLERLQRKDIPERLQQITSKALQHSPADRYPSANHMYRDLMHYLILTAPAADFMSDLSGFLAEIGTEALASVQREATYESTGRAGTNEKAKGHDAIKSAIQDAIQDAIQEQVGAQAPEKHETATEESVMMESTSEETGKEDDGTPEMPIFEINDQAADEVAESEQPHEGSPINSEILEEERPEWEKAPEIDFSQEPTWLPPGESFEAPEDMGPANGATESESGNKYYSFVDDADDDDQRTIIDVVRLSARTHKKSIVATLIALILSFIAFTAVDTFAHITPMGSTIYDFLFPPAIKIVSMPSGANVYLDDKLLDKTTPLALDEISPGVHKLVLTLPQYESIVKSISVPRKGELHLTGEAQRHGSQPYVLRFKNQFDVVSQPSGADIIIDGVKLNQQTPATVFWDVSEEPTNIELEIAGLPKLGGLRINSMVDEDYISDKRLWKLDRPIEGKAHYVVEGIFHKNITINSRPKLADIYLDASERPVGVTGVNGSLMLKIGQHSFTLKKQGYITNTFAVDVNEETAFVINKDLARRVRIFAKDALSGDDKDLGARLVEMRLDGKRVSSGGRTPAIVKLLPYSYTAKLQKKGYHDLTLQIGPDDKSIIAKMKPLYFELTVDALDAITSAPINTARISYIVKGSSQAEEIMGITDWDGRITGKLLPGTYEIIVTKTGYQEQRKSIQLHGDLDNRITFRLTGLR